MTKRYEQWIVESGMNRSMTQPVVIEYEAGKIKVYADPEAENWMGETSRIELYQDLLSELQDALKEKSEKKIKSLLKDARDLPLFGQDTSNVWKMSQIDGVENSNGKDYIRAAVDYTIRKIKLFLQWADEKT